MEIKNLKLKIKNSQEGFAALYLAILILTIMLGIALALTFLTINQEKIIRNSMKSYQSYSVAEAGIEDALLRLTKSMDWSSPYSLTLGSGASAIEISDIIGGTRTITSTGNVNNRIRKVRVVFSIESDQISFYYGAQVGDGGIVMGNNSQVQGNVFSNGTITGGNGANITNSVVIAGNGNKLQNVDVGEDATVHTCIDSIVEGTLTYVSGGSVTNCTCSSPPCEEVKTRPNQIDPISLPISSDQISEWKTAATAGGPPIGSKTVSGIESLGPVKIAGDLKVNGGATLRVTGTIYVTGNIVFDTNSIVQLDSSYGSLSGVIIADGTIIVENGTQISGSGQPSSYVLILSEKNDIVNPVIDVRNNALGDTVFYANNGLIYLKNGMRAREVTAKKIQIENTAIIQYETGLENANFSNGPGGSWEVASWKEIE
jgi:Tfp pilus assembly protein PilX